MLVRRMMAYIIDFIFIIFFISLLTQIRFINPKFEENLEVSNAYLEIYEKALAENDMSFMNSKEYQSITYEMEKTSISTTIIEIVCYIAYFVGFQIWNKGQTLGKKLMRIKVINNNKEVLNIKNLLLRTIILYNIYIEIILLVLLICLTQNNYIKVSGIITNIASIIYYISILMIILRKDNRGLHDLIAKTKVVEE